MQDRMLTTYLATKAYGPCLWCAGPAGFLAHEGPFCSDEHVSFHRQSETTWRERAGWDTLRFVAELRAGVR